jgi:hypothetical protein
MLSGCAAVAVTLVLLGGAIGHLVRPDVLLGGLRAHGVVPGALIRPVAMAVPAGEIVPALVAVHALLTGGADGLRLAMICAGALLCCYAVYSLYVARTRDDVPCGCSATQTPMSGWIAARALALAGLAGVALAQAGPAVSADGADLAVVILAGATISIVLWESPAIKEWKVG